jgi:hypothetical protein
MCPYDEGDLEDSDHHTNPESFTPQECMLERRHKRIRNDRRSGNDYWHTVGLVSLL